jgi:hypothetical protein
MALLFPLLTLLVLCSYGPVGSLGCDLPQNSVLLSRKIFDTLDQMKRISPLLCLKDRRDFQFPQEIVNSSPFQKVQAMSVLHLILQQISNLFHIVHSFAAWDPILLNKLHSELHQQPQDLRNCLV